MWKCEKLEEIIELPPNIRHINVSGCKSLERFSEVSKILEFNGSHIRSLQRIELSGFDKMHENIWNDKVQNPLLWKGFYEYDATLFPEYQIPEWLSYVHEFLKDNDDGRQRGEEEWVLDIEGPYYLEDISGIVLYQVMFLQDAESWRKYIGCSAKITTNGSNHVCCIKEGVLLVNMDLDSATENTPGYVVWEGYSNLQSFELKVLDNLRVQFDRFYERKVSFYKSCRAKVVYKNEMRAKKMDEEISRYRESRATQLFQAVSAFHFSSTLGTLELSRSDNVILPASIKRFVGLRCLMTWDNLKRHFQVELYFRGIGFRTVLGKMESFKERGILRLGRFGGEGL
ncbi:hypothetical protein F2P56_013532 [Juglans regia]|uniref:Uncharacterized protein n=1 Tax=Juglans regia TaxID=51240 RepID=A0A834CYC2_JUGRE|nr:hypothetical protein F2P56_013532 [Juglans regia]